MSTAPVPAALVFLADLDNYPTEAKVRFLGCVAHYDEKTGSALLTHHYPSTGAHQITARVNVDLVLETLDACVLQVGSWINVIGYVDGRVVKLGVHPVTVVAATATAATATATAATAPTPAMVGGNVPVYSEVSVRAVMLWSAGDVKLSSYEARLQERKDAGIAG